MSREPVTQNYSTESGAAPSYPRVIADRASNITQDNSVNRTMPWVALAMMIGGVAFGLSISAYIQGRDYTADTRARFTETETRLTNETRDLGTKCQLLKNHVDELKTAVDLRNMMKSKEVMCHE